MRGQSSSSPLEGVNNGDNIRDVEGGEWKNATTLRGMKDCGWDETVRVKKWQAPARPAEKRAWLSVSSQSLPRYLVPAIPSFFLVSASVFSPGQFPGEGTSAAIKRPVCFLLRRVEPVQSSLPAQTWNPINFSGARQVPSARMVLF